MSSNLIATSKLKLSVLSIVISGAVFSNQLHAAQCSPSQSFKPFSSEKPLALEAAENEVLVTSQKANINKGDLSQFEGSVTIYQRTNTILADSAIFNEKKNQFTAQGNIALNSDSALVTGESIFIDEDNRELELKNTKYEFAFNSGRGSSEKFKISEDAKLSLDGATFTTCAENDKSWLFSAGNIYIDQQKGWGEAWNTVFKVADVPVVYVPYITFPINNKRKTGLLFPEFGNSTRFGTYYAQPIYFNLAENYDLTFTPEYMSDRGLLAKSNFRHLSENSYNQLQINYLDNDKKLESDDARYLTYWQHESAWSDNWQVQWQYTGLSDDNYLNEFGSPYHHQADTYVNNFISIRYKSPTLNAQIKSQEIDELGPHTASYSLPLQLELNWGNKNRIDKVFHSNLYSQYSYFASNQYDVDEVHRLHVEPELSLDWYQPGYQVSISSSYLATQYEQMNGATESTNSAFRGVAKYRALAGLVFEKYTNYFDSAVKQTLEPKIQYLYVQDSDQSDIGIYDTQLLKEDYYSLFRDTSYSSVDRIASANQMAVGFSTSIFNEFNNEIFRAGVGQILRFDSDQGTNTVNVDSKPAIAVEVFGQISENWQVDGAVLYDQEQDLVETGFVSFNYWLAEDKNIQINHRYAESVAEEKINQAGLFTSYRISDDWSAAASYHYDIETDNLLDSLIGFEYRSCCWSVQFSYQRQVLVNLENEQQTSQQLAEYENSFGIKFKLNGLGGEMSSNIADLFSKSIFAYRRPYLITN